jgi:hypothetical protein
VLIGLVAAIVAFLAPGPRGPALLPDSLSYLGAAQSLARSGRLDIPAADWSDADSTSTLSQFPPLYSLALAPAVAAGLDPIGLPRSANAIAAGVSAATLSAIGLLAAGALGGVVVPALVLLSPPVTDVHLLAVSEPLFLVLVALTLLAMLRDAHLAAGIAAALAALTRYAGASLVGAVTVWAAWQTRGAPWRGRFRAMAAAVLPGIATQAAWRAWLAWEDASAPGRAPAPFPGTLRTIADGLDALAAWLAPWTAAQGSGAVRGLAALLVIAALVVCARRAVRAGPPAGAVATSRDVALRRLGEAAAVVAVAYAALLVYARRWVGGEIHFDGRILSPVVLVGGTVAGAALARGWRALPRARPAIALLCVAWLAPTLRTDLATARLQRTVGRGYEQTTFRASAVAAWLQRASAPYALFTNNPAGVWFAVPRPSRQLPASLSADSVRAFGDTLRARGGAIVGFDGPIAEMASPDSLAARLGLVAAARSRFGTIWVPPELRPR